jgi:peptidoglycan/LPS O-acetylase OafA/YrhL
MTKSFSDFFKVKFSENRIYGLDILRASAILFVVIGHGSALLPDKLKRISDFVVFDGVSIFFVLSGFLIGTILINLLEKHGTTLRTLFSFWMRRWLRTLPNYYIVLILLLIILPFLFYGEISSLFKNQEYFLFLQNFNKPHPFFFDEAWSLCVEEWFYLLIPILIFSLAGFLKISVKNSLFSTAVTIIIISTLCRYHKFLNIPINSYADWDLNIRKEVLTRLDSIMFGLVGAGLSYYFKEHWKKFKNLLFFIGIFILIIQRYLLSQSLVGFGIYECVFSFSLISFGVLLLLPFLSEYKKGSGILFSLLTFISITSYSLYLINYTLFHFYGLLLFDHWHISHLKLVLVRYLYYWLFSLLGAYLLYCFYERPAMNLREKIKLKKR